MSLQRTPEWFAARLGKVTASRVSDVIATTKTSGYSTSRANYEAELIVERLTGAPAERFQNEAMRFGTENEPHARAAYEFHRDASVTECGFIDHPFIDMAGASPDGLIGELGLIEIKVPNTATHIDTLLTQKIPEKYRTQMLWQMACTNREWCDYVSFDPRLPEDMRLFVKRLNRDNEKIAKLEAEVQVFLDGVSSKIALLQRSHDITAHVAAEGK